MDFIVLSKPEPNFQKQTGMMLSVTVPREQVNEILVENFAVLQEFTAVPKFAAYVAGYKVSCAELDCEFSLLFRSKKMSRKLAESVTERFSVLKKFSRPSPSVFEDSYSESLWGNNGNFNSDKCTWKFMVKHCSLCFNEHGFQTILELIKSNVFETFGFEKNDVASLENLSFHVPCEQKHSLTLLLICMSLRTGEIGNVKTSLGLDNMGSFHFESEQPDKDTCILSVGMKGGVEFPLSKLQALINLGYYVASLPSELVTPASWVFLTRGKIVHTWFFLSNSEKFRNLSKDSKIVLMKSNEEDGRLSKNQVKTEMHYRATFEFLNIDEKLALLLYLIDSELIAEDTSFAWLKYMYRIVIERTKKNGLLQFYVEDCDKQSLDRMVRFFELFCSILEKGKIRKFLEFSQDGKVYEKVEMKEENFEAEQLSSEDSTQITETVLKLETHPNEVVAENSMVSAVDIDENPVRLEEKIVQLTEIPPLPTNNSKEEIKRNIEPVKPEITSTKVTSTANSKKKSTFKMSEVIRTDKNISPAETKRLSKIIDTSLIISESKILTTEKIYQICPVPDNFKLQPLSLDYWIETHPEFLNTARKNPSKSPFYTLDAPLDFWVHKGSFTETINPKQFLRIFKPHQSVNSLEALY